MKGGLEVALPLASHVRVTGAAEVEIVNRLSIQRPFPGSGWFIVLATLLSVYGCGDDGPTGSGSYQYAVPQQTGDGWTTGDAVDHGIDLGPVGALFDRISVGLYENTHAVLIVRNGVLVIEEYFPGSSIELGTRDWDRDMLHDLHSVTKSFNSALIGIAIDWGLIGSVDDKISAYLPEYADLFADVHKDSIQIKHLLAMTSGLYWDEWSYPYTDPRNTHVAMNQSGNPVGYVLGLPMETSPGETFLYNSGLSITLGRILHNASGLRPDEFAAAHLFGPLGINESYWWRYPDGTVQTGGGLYLRPRDMAKLGQLYLNGGRWGAQQLISRAWVDESVEQHAPDQGYGYQWWLETFAVDGQVVDSYSANGRGGQYIFVVPELELVAVFTAGNDDARALAPFDMLERFLLPAVLAR